MRLDTALNQFRLASRELFNHYFRASASDDDAWLLVERFREIEEVLFQKLVTEPAALARVRYGDPQSDILILLRDGMDAAPITLNRDVDSGYWDYPLTQVTRGAKMVFVSFFDWDQLSYRDNQFVRVQLLDWSEHPEVNGKHALIESHNVLFDQVTKQ
jgi:hypothetical protein